MSCTFQELDVEKFDRVDGDSLYFKKKVNMIFD